MNYKTKSLLAKTSVPCGIVLGASTFTGVSIVRSLAKYKIPIILIDDSENAIGRFSRHIHSFETFTTDDDFFSLLKSIAEGSRQKNVIFCESDKYLLLVDKYRSEIKGLFYETSSPQGSLAELMNKATMLGIASAASLDVPRSIFVESDFLSGDKELFEGPYFIKPIYSQLSQRSKGEVVPDAAILRKRIKAPRFKSGCLVQEIIRGSESNIWVYAGYAGNNFKARITSYKVRQIPKDFGVGVVAISTENKEIQRIGDAFLDSIGYRGLFAFEFKKDDRDGKYEFLEINPRVCGLNQLFLASGVNLSYLAYNDVRGIKSPQVVKIRYGRKMVHIIDDFISCLRYYSKGNFRIFFQWLGTVFSAQAFSDFDLLDPSPFFTLISKHIKSLLKGSKKSFFKMIAGIVLGDISLHLLRMLHKDKLLIIYYHRVVDDDDFLLMRNRNMCVRVEEFENQMRLLKKFFNPVNGTMVKAAAENKIKLPPYPVWVTFDDAYQDNYVNAAPILKAFNVPATFYVVTDFVESRSMPWDDYVLSAVKQTKLSEVSLQILNKEYVLDLRREVSRRESLRLFWESVGEVHMDTDKQLKALIDAFGVPLNDIQRLFVNWHEIKELVSDGFEIGAHTVSHKLLSRISNEEVEREISSSKDLIQKHTDAKVRSFAYPFGKKGSFDAVLCSSFLAKHGFDLAVTTSPGWNANISGNRFVLRRMGISFNDSLGFFKFKVATASFWQKG